jgi:hypothetical protein
MACFAGTRRCPSTSGSQRPQEGGLPGAAPTEQRDEFSGGDVEVEAVEHYLLAEHAPHTAGDDDGIERGAFGHISCHRTTSST